MLTMIHYVQPVLTDDRVEFHLEHGVSPTRGQHAVKTAVAFEEWLLTSQIERLVVLADPTPCGCGLSPGQARCGPGRVPACALVRDQRARDRRDLVVRVGDSPPRPAP